MAKGAERTSYSSIDSMLTAQLQRIVYFCQKNKQVCRWTPTFAISILIAIAVASLVSFFGFIPFTASRSAQKLDGEDQPEDLPEDLHNCSDGDAEDSYEFKRDESDWSSGDEASVVARSWQQKQLQQEQHEEKQHYKKNILWRRFD